MARAKSTRLVREYVEPVSDGVPEDAVRLDPDAQRAEELAEAQIPEDEISEIFRVTDEMRTTGGVVLQFVRVLPVTLSGYCGEMVPAEFTLERVRKEFGVGTYRVRVMGPKGFVPGGGKLIIAPLPEKPVTAQTGVEDVLAILRADKESSGAKMKEWAVILTPLLTPVITSFLAPKNQVNELVQGLAALKGLQPEEKPLGSQLDSIAGVMAKLKELAGEEKTTTGATWIDLIRDAVQGVKPILEQVAGRALGATPQQPVGIPMLTPPPVQLPGPAAPATISVPGNGGSEAPASVPPGPVAGAGLTSEVRPVGVVSMLPWLSATLAQLIAQAARNKDPELYAEVTLDNVPDGVDPKQLIPFLERADWWAQLQTFAPAVSPYPAWFADYREAVLVLLKEDTAPPQVFASEAGGEIHEGSPQPMGDDVQGDGM